MSLIVDDIGIILSVKKYSESSLILKILSKDHGIYSGFIKGAVANKKNVPIYQIANLVEFSWKSKTIDNLGIFKLELSKSYLAKIIFNNLKLNCVRAIFTIINENILEREPHPELFQDLSYFLDNIDESDDNFLASYIKLELGILQTLGYGIDLSSCALTGVKEGLYFVSPKSGRAACKEAGLKYQDKLLRLPEFLIKKVEVVSKEDLFLGLNLTNFFLTKHLMIENKDFFNFRSKLLHLANHNTKFHVN